MDNNNLNYHVVQYEADRQELEQAADKAWNTWDHRPQAADATAYKNWHDECRSAMNDLGVALMRLGLGPGAKPKRAIVSDPREALPPPNPEAFTTDDRQRGPL